MNISSKLHRRVLAFAAVALCASCATAGTLADEDSQAITNESQILEEWHRHDAMLEFRQNLVRPYSKPFLAEDYAFEEMQVSLAEARKASERLVSALQILIMARNDGFGANGHPMCAAIDFGARHDATERAEKLLEDILDDVVSAPLEEATKDFETAASAFQSALADARSNFNNPEVLIDKAKAKVKEALTNAEKNAAKMKERTSKTKQNIVRILQFIDSENAKFPNADAKVLEKMKKDPFWKNRFGL